MLKSWLIRTKVRIAMFMLLAVVLLLSATGLMGLYDYRSLTEEVRRQSGDIPLTGRLNQLATEMQSSHLRRQNVIRKTNPLAFSERWTVFQSVEQQLFNDSLQQFESLLEQFQEDIEVRKSESLMVNETLQRQLIADISQTVREIQDLADEDHPDDETEALVLDETLEKLHMQTGELASQIYQGMSNFGDEIRSRYRARIVIAWATTVIAIAIIASMLIGLRSYVVKPFQILLEGSRLVAGGQFQHEIELGTKDELNELATVLNGITRRFHQYCSDFDAEVRQRTKELIRNEQLASTGFMAAGIAHELNNPLTSVAWSAESLLNRTREFQWPKDQKEFQKDLDTSLQRIESQSYRCSEIISKLLDFSRLSEMKRDRHDLAKLTGDVVSMVQTMGRYKCKEILIEAEPEVVAHVNSKEISQVLVNLVTNALESVDDNGLVKIQLSTEDNRAVVTVTDNGCGMSDEVLEHLFEPFFTRRRDGTGTGLGLSITYRIVSMHGGTLTAESGGSGKGSTLRMMLPVNAEDDPVDSVSTQWMSPLTAA